MADRLHRYGDKVRGGLDALYTSPLSAKVLDLINAERDEPATELLDRVVTDALGLSNSEFSYLKASKGRPGPGRILDLAALMGFGPPPDRLLQLEKEFEDQHGYSPYPDHVYRMLDRWCDDTPACRCWSALAGGPKQLERLGSERGDRRARGASAEDFLRAYQELLPQLIPQLFDTVHWADEPPFDRRSYRVQHLKTPYLRQTGGPLPQPAVMPAWLDPTRGTSLLDDTLPEYGRSTFEMREKATLYGGRSAQQSAGFSPLQFAVARHSFDRQSVAVLRRQIRSASKHCCSFTLKAGRGAGLSLALAQLVRDLCSDARTKVLWLIGDPARTRELLAALDEEKAQELARWAAASCDEFERLVLVIDDVSLAKPREEVSRLLRFLQRCKVLFPTLGGPKLAFVFGSFGDAPTCSEDAAVELRLTPRDQQACYEKMAREEPRVIAGHPGGLEGLIRDHPEARWHADDAQALADFFLEHGEPNGYAARHWLARTDDLEPADLEIVTLAAVAQLAGLHIPERVAVKLFADVRRPPFDDAEDIAQTVGRLAVEEEEWRGVGLSCPRRAKSILERTERFEPEFLVGAFERLVTAALDEYERRRSDRDALAFARHVFQRLSKREFYVFEHSATIVERLLGACIGRLEGLMDRWSLVEQAQWAGALSGILGVRGPTFPTSGVQPACAALVARLCEACVARIEESNLPAEAALGLLRSGARLIRSGSVAQTSALELALREVFPLSAVSNLARRQLQAGGEDPVRRANELVHAYCRFERACWRNRPPRSVCYEISGWLYDMEHLFARHAAALDAGAWLERDAFVWVHGPAQARLKDLDRRERFIDRAEACIAFNPQAQGTWTEHVTNARKRLAAIRGHEPSLGKYVDA